MPKRPTKRGDIIDTADAWAHILPTFRGGDWYRIEANFPFGLFDAFGFWNGQTWTVEIKTERDRIRPAQELMAQAAAKNSVVIWRVFVMRDGRVSWYPRRPPFAKP